LICYDIIKLYKECDIKYSEHSNKKNNYNSMRKNKDNFIISYEKLKSESIGYLSDYYNNGWVLDLSDYKIIEC